MSCWTVLGLPASSDARNIKRQYARLLKITRPDEDPAAFQRLREAYEQALYYKEQEAFSEPDEALIDDVTVQALPTSELSPAQRVAPLLHNLHSANLDQRYQQAIDALCPLEFELALLRHCVEHPGHCAALLDWAFANLHWLSAWQRLELPDYLVQALLEQCYQNLEQPLRLALANQDGAAFVQIYEQRTRHPWLQSLQHRQWLDDTLVDMLLDSPYWLTEVFLAVSAGQGWNPDADNACLPAQWERLLARHQAPLFLAQQRQLASEPPASPEHRAARLLLGPLSFRQRRALARRLRPQDWASCRQLSARLYANHPQVTAEMPGGSSFFWRDWEFAFEAWPMYLGLVLACLAGAFARYAPLHFTLSEIGGVAIFWGAAFAIFGALLWWLWQPLAHRLWLRDEQLSARLPRWLSPAPGDVLLLRDLLPNAVLIAGLSYFCDSTAGAVYGLVLLGAAITRRQELKPLASWEKTSPWRRNLLIAAGCTLLIASMAAYKLASDQSRVLPNQGLQPWSERLCARMPASADSCAAPATDEQWYGREPRS